MPTMLYAVIFYFSPTAVGPLNGNIRLYMLAGIVISTFFIPVLFIYILYQFKAIESLQMENQRDRTLPFTLTTIIYGTFTYFFFWRLNSLTSIYLILGSITLAVGLVTIINLFWKISAHSVGISGLIGSLIGIHYKFADSELFYPILVFILIAGSLMSARLSVNAHNPSQILAGCALGLSISLGAVYWFI
jgi:hypothetical protein